VIEESWLLQFIEKAKAFGAKTALDIGANVRTWTEVLVEHFDRVIAVEPDHRAFAELVKQASGRVMCHHAAIASKMGAIDLHLRPHTVQSSLLLEHPVGSGDQGEAPVIETVGVNGMTMDFLIFTARERFGDLGTLFIKVDVEGSEGDVLAGATDPEFRHAAWLIEVHDRREAVGLGLQRLGYDGIAIVPHPHSSAHPEHGWVYTEPAYAP
jgi:FkbM family methyltransferase